MAKVTSTLTINGVKYSIKDQYLRDEIEKLVDKGFYKAGEGIEISEDNVISVKEEEEQQD
jgi:hypothetical protein